MYSSGHTINKVVRRRGRLQRDGNGAAWSQSGGSFQLLLPEVQPKDCPAFGRPDGMTHTHTNTPHVKSGALGHFHCALHVRTPTAKQFCLQMQYRDNIYDPTGCAWPSWLLFVVACSIYKHCTWFPQGFFKDYSLFWSPLLLCIQCT